METDRTTAERQPLELWEHLFGDLRGSLVTFTGQQARRSRDDARPNELDATEQHSWKYPEEKHAAVRYLIAQSEAGRDAYFGVHLFTQPNTRRGEYAADILALWVDGDGALVPEDWPQPTAVVESSPGRHHYYWRLTRPVPPETATDLNKRLTYGMGGDKGKWGLGTVLRVPGTSNFKRDTPSTVEGEISA